MRTSAGKLSLLLGDIIIFFASLAITISLRYPSSEFSSHFFDHISPFTLILPLWLIVFYLFNLYETNRLLSGRLIETIFYATLISSLFSVTIFYFFPTLIGLTPKTNLFIFSLLFWIFKSIWQFIFTRLIPARRQNIIIIGDSPRITAAVSHLNQNPLAGYKITAWLKTNDKLDPTHLLNLAKTNHTHLIIVSPELTKNISLTRLTYELLSEGINIVNFWDFYENIFAHVPLEELKEVWFIENIVSHRPTYDKIKRFLDIIISLFFIIVLSPLFLIIYLLIPLTSSGPSIFKQLRTGQDNLTFTLYKFRTMNYGAVGPLAATKNDTRVTSLGRFLRLSHLDELPQLWNILKGDISLIGPRPERIELVAEYKKLPFYEMRHIIKPGLTGWAQINYRPSASLNEAGDKLAYDIYYIKHRSFVLDILIAIKTIRYLFVSSYES